MKKLIILLLLACSISFAQAQDRKVIQSLFTALPVHDTTFTYTWDNNYMWGFQLVWTGAKTGLNGIVTLQVSNYPTTNFVKYSTTSLDSIQAATGNWTFSDDKFLWKYFRVTVADNDSVGCLLTAKVVKSLR